MRGGRTSVSLWIHPGGLQCRYNMQKSAESVTLEITGAPHFAMLAAFGCPVPKISLLAGLAKLAFFAAPLFTFYSAVIPPQHALQLVPWDKAEHFIAFYGLTGLAAAAFPKRNLIVIAAMLSGFGALIEFV